MLLYGAIRNLVNIIEILIFARIIMSFLNIQGAGPISNFINLLTEPIIGPARALIYKAGINTGMFDFSPVLAILFLQIIVALAGKILL